MEIVAVKSGKANCYGVAASSGAFLVDCGVPGNLEEIEHQLLAKGILPERLKLLLLTHSHIDHGGNALALKQKYHLPIAVLRYEGEDAPLQSRGPVGRLIRRSMGSGPVKMPEIKPDLYLEDGQKLHEFGLPGRVIALPGHTGDSLGLLLDGGKLLLCGDMYMNFVRPGLANLFTDRASLLESHERLKGYPIETVYPGHGKPFAFSALK